MFPILDPGVIAYPYPGLANQSQQRGYDHGDQPPIRPSLASTKFSVSCRSPWLAECPPQQLNHTETYRSLSTAYIIV
jgi:hypothetical protein